MASRTDLTAEALSVRLGAHIGALADRVRDVEHLLSRDVGRLGAPSPDFLTGLQSLDFLHQSLADAAIVLAHSDVHLAATFNPEADLLLEVSRTLVAGDDPNRPASGEPDLF